MDESDGQGKIEQYNKLITCPIVQLESNIEEAKYESNCY